MKQPLRVDLINIGDDWQCFAIRSALECYGITVMLHPIATAQHLVDLLNGSTPLSQHLVFMCHGHPSGKGVDLPELGEEIEAKQPFHGVVTADDFAQFLKLPANCDVLNPGCMMGTDAFAQAFLSSGSRSYIGATDYPDGDAALFYVLHFFYELHCRGSTLEEAHQKARSHNEETQMYALYT